ncbi:MAG TPA: hypothetical protein VES60_09590 [Nakamurella sp.]|nr:hypothetical protein [Nakamurella sp.]
MPVLGAPRATRATRAVRTSPPVVSAQAAATVTAALSPEGEADRVVCRVAALDPWPAPSSFAPPAPGDGMVRRSALVRQLTASGVFPVVLLRAPAGYGKTTVLAQWSAADPRPFAWLTVDEERNDAEQLHRDIGEAIASLRRRSPGGASLPNPGEGESVEDVLVSAPEPFVLVVDDAQLITDPAARRLVDGLMIGVPAGSQLVISTRGAAPTSLSRLRADHRVLEITAPELAFDADEALAGLAAAGWNPGSPKAAQALVEVCEGWPAVLSLAGTAASGISDRGRPALAGSDRKVTDYLQTEVLSGIDEPTLRFLTRTSILTELSGPLCDAVCDTVGSGVLLRDLHRGALPIIPMDNQDQRYRYHPLLRQALLAELERRESATVTVLHGRARRWFAERGEVDAAIRHAGLGGDVSTLGELVWAHLHRGVADGGPDRVRRWLAGLTDQQIGRSPELVVASAWLSLVTGDLESMARWQALARAIAAAASPDGADAQLGAGNRPDYRGALMLLAAWRGTGGMAEALQLCTDAFEALPAGSTWRPAAGALSGIALALSGRPGLALSRVRDSEELAAALGDHAAQVDCLVALGALAFDRGLWCESEDLVMRAHALMTTHRLQDLPTSAYAVSMVALVQARRGESAEAAHSLDRAHRLTGAVAGLAPWIQIHARVLQANTSLMLGDAAAARRLTCQARQLAGDRSLPPLLSSGLEQAEQTLAHLPADSTYGLTPFTVAELRILRLLPTHLSFPEMGTMLFVSRHTVKTQALSTYRKLGASSRHEAVERACALGYLPPTSVPARIA